MPPGQDKSIPLPTICQYLCWIIALALLVCGCDPAPPSNENKSDVQAAVTEPAGKTELTQPVSQHDPAQVPTREPESSAALKEFLVRFDKLSTRGFVPTLRAGSTGIGYTLETMLGIEENNSQAGDFLGMEIKAFRDNEDDDLHMDDAEKMNLFLKEPEWIDGLSAPERVRQYGYIDENQRPALYSTVTINKSSHQFAFRVDNEQKTVWLQFDDRDVAFWGRDVLEKRLIEKHSEAVFVAAHTRGSGRDEEFHYHSVTWCCEPSVDSFIRMIESGDVMLELRMHLQENESVRNHGSAFRIKQNRIPKLYRVSKQVRRKE